jgi:acetoin utilization deacetylase AcuC-like enzyme
MQSKYSNANCTTFEVYRDSLKIALQNIIEYGPDLLVLSLGVDTFVDDPVGGFKLQSPDFKTIGNLIAELEIPTHFIMEGGYAMEALGKNVGNVVTGFCKLTQ